jgi:prophage antirepressor-like protein
MQHQLKALANPFQFSELDIRTATDEHSEVWFCAKDICTDLNISWSSMALENMPENWFMVINRITLKG